ncbi:adenylyltransferase and sulfurtransferase MOCS3 [Camelus ferus]|uniref:Adenylyltransferase and sulfurtransferase MOCS3 n=2 Tax=Camelus TaxID=9836 RepID=S9YWE5_CAMFR|nr:adenylyltransferase and sulfurtransferase MOCS3 [Camelus ferus]XP_045375252.1 adenylyltransferase and sulfurtransferase MOCS3 [Camelus bactrianus]EPY88325.1 Molybdenum cofactor synthesis protein 3-like protein [Camelus ferus]
MAGREEVLSLQAEVAQREEELSSLKQRLAAALVAEQESERLIPVSPLPPKAALSRDEILRYSRQLVLPELGVQGQLRLATASVLVVGCGGLGCPLAQYLAAAGIGRLGLVDYDVVEVSNLARQVLHGEALAGQAKVFSAAASLRRLNSAVECVPYAQALTPATALDLVRRYDVVADCSDNVPTRYLVNDACVLVGRPLVSASALRFEGQITVYHYGSGPCYRCIFPQPPPAETVTNCADGGVLGVVTGVLGCLQALEVLKIAAGLGPSYSGSLLLFDALRGHFRCIQLRRRRPDCAACGERPTVTDLQDYEDFCGSSATDKCRSLQLLTPEERVSVIDYKRLLDSGSPHLLLDVRPQVEVDICRLPHALHIPLKYLERRDVESLKLLGEAIRVGKQGTQEGASLPIYVICKLGNDSQKAVKILQSLTDLNSVTVQDVVGGLMAWAAKIDGTFPQY